MTRTLEMCSHIVNGVQCLRFPIGYNELGLPACNLHSHYTNYENYETRMYKKLSHDLGWAIPNMREMQNNYEATAARRSVIDMCVKIANEFGKELQQRVLLKSNDPICPRCLEPIYERTQRYTLTDEGERVHEHCATPDEKV